MYRTSLNTCLGAYLLQHAVDPATKQGWRLNGASDYRTSCKSAEFIDVARAPFAQPRLCSFHFGQLANTLDREEEKMC